MNLGDNTEPATVLIVDDSKNYIHSLSRMLKDDYRVLVANNGFKALQLAAGENVPDLILLDIMMPEIDGYEVCRRLKSEEHTKDIPIIFVTGRESVEDEEKGFNLGAVDYITKPFHPAIVRARVKNQTERIRAENELKNLYAQLDEDVKEAEKIHKRLLPKAIPEVEGVNIAAHYQPAARMGGDFYNIILSGKKLIIYLSDVMGHGMDGAIINVFAKETINSFVSLQPEQITPQNLMLHLGRQYHQENYPDFQMICVFIVVLDTETMQLAYTSVGMQTPPLFVTNNGERKELVATGLPISNVIPVEMLDLEEYTVDLSRGGTILLSTDGLQEQSSGEEQFENYYKNIFYENYHLLPEKIMQEINSEFFKFNSNSLIGDDDITYLILQVDQDKT